MAIKGLTHISLSVTDLDRSVGFYRDVLGLPTLVDRFDGTAFDGEEVMFFAGRTALCLQAHTANGGEQFDPRRTGLDHLALAVETMDELEVYVTRLTELGIAHSGIRPITGFGHVIELRDPDGIQLELHLLDRKAPSRERSIGHAHRVPTHRAHRRIRTGRRVR